METIKPMDFTKVLKKEYVGKWVALSQDYKQVVAVGDSMKKVSEDATEKGFPQAILHKVLPFDQGFIPNVQ